MVKILYVPLDERPCNIDYPVNTAMVARDIELMVLPKELMGYKKTPGNTKAIADFIAKAAKEVDYAVISTEMLLYGGLLPSRLHHFEAPQISAYEQKIRQLKNENPQLKLYLSNLIMRTPKYDSSDEEPDYYETYGAAIFRHAWLQDKAVREGLTDEMALLKQKIPAEYLVDYEKRQIFNAEVDLTNIRLVETGVIDFLAIPQDDSAPYGYTAIDQQKIYGAIAEKNLKDQIMVYALMHSISRSQNVNHHELIITKPVDKSSPLLAKALSDNEKMAICEFILYRTSKAGIYQPYYKINLSKARISSIDFVTPHAVLEKELEPQERIAFIYEDISWEHTLAGTNAMSKWQDRVQ